MKLLVVFEGIDGCGKSTQAQLLKDSLDKSTLLGYHTKLVTNPLNKNLGIRKFLSDTEFSAEDPFTKKISESLFVTDKFLSLYDDEKFKDLFSDDGSDEIVIMDRFYMSLVYNMNYEDYLVVRDGLLNMLKKRGVWVFTVYLNISLENSIKRIDHRGETKEIFETPKKLVDAQDKFLSAIGHELSMKDASIVVLDGERHQFVIGNDIMEILQQKIDAIKIYEEASKRASKYCLEKIASTSGIYGAVGSLSQAFSSELNKEINEMAEIADTAINMAKEQMKMAKEKFLSYSVIKLFEE